MELFSDGDALILDCGVDPKHALALCAELRQSGDDRGIIRTDPRPRHLRLADRFRSVVAGGDVGELEPSALPLLAIARQLGVEPERLVMVGDSPDDIRAAKRCGARSIAFSGGGVWKRSDLAALGPTSLVDRLEDVAVELHSFANEADGESPLVNSRAPAGRAV